MAKDNSISLSAAPSWKRKLRCLQRVQRKLEGATSSLSSYQLVKMQIVVFCLGKPIDSGVSRGAALRSKNAKHSFIVDDAAGINPFQHQRIYNGMQFMFWIYALFYNIQENVFKNIQKK